jgi:ABC-type amino acid transport substrate-binding protein
VAAALLASFLAVSSAQAQFLDGTLLRIKNAGTITIGYRDSSPPFSFARQDDSAAGYSVDLCRIVAAAVEKKLGMPNLKQKWVRVTAENRVQMVVDGKVDLECSTTTATLERQERVDFSLMTFIDGAGLLTMGDSPLLTSPDITGKRIAIIPETTTGKALATAMKGDFASMKIVNVKDHAAGLAALEEGRADAFASDRSILAALALTTENAKRFALSRQSFSYEPYGLMMKRNDAAFRLVVNRALADLYRSGEIAVIYERWFGLLGAPGEALQAMYMINGLPE